MIKNIIRRPIYSAAAKAFGGFAPSVLTASRPWMERTWEYPWILRMIGQLERGGEGPLSILDVGCSTASVLPLWLVAQGFNTTGVDLRDFSESVPGFKFHQLDVVKDSPGKLETYDIITCVSTFEHVGLGGYPGDDRDDLKASAFAKALGRLTKPTGAILMTIPFGRAGLTDSNRIDVFRVYTQEELAAIFSRAGLTILRQDCVRVNSRRIWEPCSVVDGANAPLGEGLCGLVLTNSERFVATANDAEQA